MKKKITSHHWNQSEGQKVRILAQIGYVHGQVGGEKGLDLAAGERVYVLWEGVSDRGRADHVLEDQVPAHDECDQLAYGHVDVDVGRAGAGNARAQLRVADPGEEGGQASDQEREEDGGTGERGDHGAH